MLPCHGKTLTGRWNEGYRGFCLLSCFTRGRQPSSLSRSDRKGVLWLPLQQLLTGGALVGHWDRVSLQTPVLSHSQPFHRCVVLPHVTGPRWALLVFCWKDVVTLYFCPVCPTSDTITVFTKEKDTITLFSAVPRLWLIWLFSADYRSYQWSLPSCAGTQ